jgi:predicted dehydrogenase
MSKKKDLTRRDFISRTAQTAAGVAAGAAAVSKSARAQTYKSIMPASVVGANELIRTGHIGTGNMGLGNLGSVLGRDDMLPIAICEIWPENMKKALSYTGELKVSTHHHYEEIIENKDVDAVVVSTPDHWHALPAIQACDAGKAVYCEKPMTTTIVEAKHVLAAAKRNNTIFQGGTLQRSADTIQEAVQLLREKAIGDVFHVDTYYHDDNFPYGMGNPPDSDPPKGCDWDLHQGWVERVPFNENRHIYSFRFFFDYAGGRLTDWGVHLVDIAMWALGEDKMPKSVVAQGGKFVIEDNRTTPDTFDALWEFDDYTISFCHRACNAYPKANRNSHGMVFYGPRGTMVLSRAGYEIIPQVRKKKSGEMGPYCKVAEAKQGGDLYAFHWANFAESVRGEAKPVSHAQALYNSTVACHMATCAYKANGKLFWDNEKEEFVGGDPEATKKGNAWANRPYNNGYKLI